ncbi:MULTISPECIES: ketopantoate reductase family protein [Pyrobaculum]|uniref:2-dehydropantoate 2-reductase n=2 Tax=Pyrobaculum arsenaticum TaxID=121277 RepID=A4WMD3_PYRAR|nr:ketopantoate reductase family protein [Pyrobaculum arsenaticum]ABP51550.1 ketopantoate reductase [Pyrobaculum arsenaticum DSM 13514]MCY0891028.1 ketopantoate reductase family protein [Pyrobaculum arsenaticum]NYR16481.1 ketopantoate reductase family protein [Pyrobaculum arsenaticum]
MIGVVGLGAVGSLFVYFLNRAGIVPRVVQRRRCPEYVFCAGGQCGGLRFADVADLGDVEYTVVAVKAYDSASVVPLLRGVAVVAQNGIGGYEAIKERYPNSVPAVVTYGVYREGCRSELRGVGEIYLPRAAERLAEALREGGANVVVVDDIEPVRWLKLAVNAAINAVTGLLQGPNGVVVALPQARELASAVVGEVAKVAEALGVKIPKDPLEEVLRIAAATSKNISSTAQDLAMCRRTEIDYLNGTVLKYGEALGIDVPYNKALYLLVKAKEVLCAGRE